MYEALRELDDDECSRSRSHSPPPSSSRVPRGSACGLVYDETMLKHAICGLERPDRLVAIMRHLSANSLPELCEQIPARPCSESEARLVHSAEHWERLLGLPDAPLPAAQMESNEHTAQSSRLAAGSVVELTERVCCGSLRSGFALVRPPGHHAGHSSMQGFCFLNNIAIAARVAQQRHKLKRILVLDWDVHHGNGTEAMLASDPGIMYVSLHRRTRDFYPRTGDATDVGSGAGRGYTVNVPWKRVAMGDREYMRAFDEVVMPIAAHFAPELVLVSAGFDASHGDPLGEMHLTASAYAHMIRQMQALAGGRIVCALEGGYRLKSTATGVAATLRALARPDEAVRSDAEPCSLDNKTRRAVEQSCAQTINEVCKVHRQFWGVLHKRELPKRLGTAGGPGDGAGAEADGQGSGSTDATGSDATSASAASSARTSMRGDGAAEAESAGAEEGAESAGRSARGLAVVVEVQPRGSGTVSDTCRACGEVLAKAFFSKSQWRRLTAGKRTCAGCVAGTDSSTR